MVCEGPPRPRQLLVSRRGSFFEDPFFRDAWDDYSHAVRRIVDRFNRGWVSPSDRLRDSQYHSMYRTLRSARLNYSTHSARFKEEGNTYKLVMDVREFVGGDITVRTAGGTVSVRGKLEVSTEEEDKRKSGSYDNDTSSSISGKSSSAKTLHRRFTLPADANCEKVESMLSRDAILTITIPKRTDVHYIPVNIEGEDKENEACVGSRKAHDGTRQPSVKRPSDSPPQATRKKSQDESFTNRRKSWREDRDHSRYKPKEFDTGDRTGARLEKEKEKRHRDESNGKRKRYVDGKKEEENLTSTRPRRRDKSKYEEVQEINIPIRISKKDPSDKVFRPSSIHESPDHQMDFGKDRRNSSENSQESDIDMENGSEKNEPKVSYKDNTIPINISNMSTRPKGSSLFKSNLDRLDLSKPKESKGEDEDSKGLVSSLRDYSYRNKDKEEDQEEKKKEKWKENERIIFPKAPENERQFENSQNIINIDVRASRDSTPETALNNYLNKRDSVPSINISREDSTVDSTETDKASDIDEKTEDENNTSEEQTKDFSLKNGKNLSDSSTTKEMENESPKRNSLGAPKINLLDRPSSPVSPGSKIIKVEEDPSLMEEGIFKDCWSDFSNTLQDVLSRLQELSSELGHSKVIATTPSTESSPPVINEDFAANGDSSKCIAKDVSCDPVSNSININKNISTHGYNNDVGGVGRNKGGSKDDDESAHFPIRTGHGHSKDDDLDDDDLKSKDTPQTQPAQKAFKSTENDAPQINNTWVHADFPKAERPSSLDLRSVASPTDKSSPQGRRGSVPFAHSSRPNSLLLSDTVPGSLLESLRKNSPVESLQEDFLKRSIASKPSQRKEVFVPVEVDEEKAVLVGGNRKGEERSNSLSPSDAQSNVEPDESESEYGSSSALGNSAQCKLWVENSDFNDSESKILKPHKNVNIIKDPILNDLSKGEIYLKDDLGEHSSTSSIYEPNIDNSPESNLTDDSDSSSQAKLLLNRFSFPSAESNDETNVTKTKDERNKKSQPFSLSDVIRCQNPIISDVIESDSSANKSHPEIPSDDAMVCERHLPPSSRVPRKSAKEESLRFSRVNRPRDLLLKEVSGDAEVLRESNGDMGGVLSRGRKTPPRRNSESLSENSTTNSPSAYSSSPSRKTKPRYPLPPEEKPIPSYVRLRTEPKRNSGFAHVNSDNVRRMRDVWGSKQEPSKPPQNPLKSPKVSPSPTRLTSNRSSDINDRRSPARSLRGESPCRSDFSSDKVRSSSLNRSSPQPEAQNSPHLPKGHGRFFREFSPSSPKLPHSYKTTTPSSNNGSRRGSQASQDRSSPIPSSPCRRCSRNARESPSPSPSVETKPKFNYGTHTSEREEKKRSKASPSNSFRRDSMKSQSAGGTPQASKVHQKIFKRLRDASLQPDSEAICFKEVDDKYKMVLDVEEYVPGEIEVLQDDFVLTVKGRVERKDPVGHISVKTFHRTFNIPKNSREEEIDSALSKDGILTIYVPKKRERVIKIELVD